VPGITVNLPLELLVKIDEIVKEERKSRSEIIASLLEKALETG